MATNRQLATKLTPEEKAALEEFSALVDSIPNKPENDYRYYLRWLRARKFNVKRAVEMFRKVSTVMLICMIFQHISPFLAHGIQGTL